MKILVVLVAVFACSCSVLCGVSVDSNSKTKSIFDNKPVRRLTKFRKDLESFPTPAFFNKKVLYQYFTQTIVHQIASISNLIQIFVVLSWFWVPW